jgi:cytidylate kinase
MRNKIQRMGLVIAIDGTAGSGKGTIAKAVSKHFMFSYLDTGLIYRSIAKLVLDKNNGELDSEVIIEVARKFCSQSLNLKGLRTSEIGVAASKIAGIKKVRDLLFNFQKEFPKNNGDCVLDGRDIGTHIFPDAKVKLYIDANLLVRAKRRFLELSKTKRINLDDITQDLRDRDHRDVSRETSPLKISEDAHLIDTTELSIQASIDKAIKIVGLKIK